MSDSEYEIPNDSDVTPADIEPNANLSCADLLGADLSGARLSQADLSEADLRNTDLSGANLRNTDLSEADLRGAHLSKADLRNTDLSDLNMDQSTQLGAFCTQPNVAHAWDDLAQSYHSIKTEFSDHGLDAKARKARYFERRARTREALEPDVSGDQDILVWVSGFLSRILTGYGTRVSHVLAWTAVLLVLPALWYAAVPISSLTGGPVYYSVVTFVTSPPNPPGTPEGLLGILTEAIVLFQTYTGTALIILFGYVLSNRDRI